MIYCKICIVEDIIECSKVKKCYGGYCKLMGKKESKIKKLCFLSNFFKMIILV